MELTLPPKIPVTRVVNGHNVFNKGYVHGLRGKTYEEYYGEEIAKRLKQIRSERFKGHPFWGNNKAHAFRCVAVLPDGKWCIFESITDAAKKMGVNYATLRRYIKRRCNASNGWKWFLESDNNWIKLVKQYESE